MNNVDYEYEINILKSLIEPQYSFESSPCDNLELFEFLDDFFSNITIKNDNLYYMYDRFVGKYLTTSNEIIIIPIIWRFTFVKAIKMCDTLANPYTTSTSLLNLLNYITSHYLKIKAINFRPLVQ